MSFKSRFEIGSTNTLCIGVDITWWGGNKRDPTSRCETIVAVRLSELHEIHFTAVDLSPVPNSSSDSTEPNYDSDGLYLVDALRAVIDKHAVDTDRVVIALDAPLDAKHRVNQPPRRKQVSKGERMGSLQRECEDRIREYMKQMSGTARSWNKQLKIQAGSPVPKRIANVVGLLEQDGFNLVRSGNESFKRCLVEIFPSEAIWSLGFTGHYMHLLSHEVRGYKSIGKSETHLSLSHARELALRPLVGFERVLCENSCIKQTTFASWVDRIAGKATSCSMDKAGGTVRTRKGFDDTIDSGIAALTSVAYAMDRYHLFGNGSDGTIVGPGTLSM